MSEIWQNLSYLGRTCVLVPVPKVGTITWSEAKLYRYHQSGTGTQSQKGVGTDTNQSSTGTNASSNPDFCTLALLSPNSSTDSIGTLINY